MTSATSAPARGGMSKARLARPSDPVSEENAAGSAAPSTRAITVARSTGLLAGSFTAICNRARLPESQVLALRSEEHTSELQSLRHLVCRLLLEKKKK